MDTRVVDLYCKYIIKPLDERKSQLERELLTAKFWNKSKIKKELEVINELFYEKLRKFANLVDEEAELSNLIFSEEE